MCSHTTIYVAAVGVPHTNFIYGTMYVAAVGVPHTNFIYGTMYVAAVGVPHTNIAVYVFSYDCIRRCSWSPPHQYQNGVGLVLAPRHCTRRMQARLDLASIRSVWWRRLD
jgi:hypothetical protein